MVEMATSLEAYLPLAAVVFSAGGFVAGVYSLRKDLTGMRGVINRLDAREDRRHKRTAKLLGQSQDPALREGALGLVTDD